MARRRFFVNEIRRGVAELTGDDAEHLVRVLRVEPGQIFEISDNTKVYLAEVETARKSLVAFTVKEALPVRQSSVEIKLLASLFKFDRFEWLVEKATELGISVIQPVNAVRSEHGLQQASIKRLARWRRIAVEASQQSRRDHLPEIRATVPLLSALSTTADAKLLLDEDPLARPIVEQLPANKQAGQTVALLLGPEGGWTEAEHENAISAGWLPCSIGPNILRAETAGIAALAIVQAAWQGIDSNL